ncbi:MAG: NAD(P)-binding domain-containing protein [Anaerolineales bacterium]|nr:NAD(P)-binding domain-containing protein [Anaerolineales bacterium]
MSTIVDVVVVGAGQAGLVASYLLSLDHVQHLVLERGDIGQSWRTQRWDSFHLNTPNWANGLAGMEFHPEEPHAFAGRNALVAFFEDYASIFHLPIRPRTNVTSLRRTSGGLYALRTQSEEMHAKAVILASGGISRPRVPTLARQLPNDIAVCSAGTYRNPEALPKGAVLVIGSGQSGCQIAEELLEAGRDVYLSVSKVARVPRSYRGRDILAWWRDMSILDVKLQQLEDQSLQSAAQPQVSGTHGGHTVSLQSLARDGAVLVGRVLDADHRVLKLDGSVRECIRFADEKSRAFKAAIDTHIDGEGIVAEAPQPDPGEPSLPDLRGSEEITKLDLTRAGVSSVIWCTGFDADWSWVEVDVLDQGGRPRHTDGITEFPGLYFLGMPWLSARKSGILFGVSDDAARIVQHIRNDGFAD